MNGYKIDAYSESFQNQIEVQMKIWTDLTMEIREPQ